MTFPIILFLPEHHEEMLCKNPIFTIAVICGSQSVIISELKVCNVSQLCKAYDHKFCFPTSTQYSTCQFKQQ